MAASRPASKGRPTPRDSSATSSRASWRAAALLRRDGAPSRRSSAAALQEARDEVAELSRGVGLPFDAGREAAIAVDQGGLEVVGDRPLVRPELHSEESA